MKLLLLLALAALAAYAWLPWKGQLVVFGQPKSDVALPAPRPATERARPDARRSETAMNRPATPETRKTGKTARPQSSPGGFQFRDWGPDCSGPACYHQPTPEMEVYLQYR